MTTAFFSGTGRRKESVARVRLVPGEGIIIVNGKPATDYFHGGIAAEQLAQPFSVTNTARRFNVMVKVVGGGLNGQLDAIRHGIARALLQANAEYRAALRKAGLLTRDPRARERKKYGLKRARKAPQYTKR